MPLTGLRILDLTRLLPGPYCTMVLGDLGADVVKVEDMAAGDYLRWMPPLEGEWSAAFHALNRNKRAVRIDLRQDGGRDAFLALCARADVVVESFRPGVMDRLGVGWKAVHAANPALVLCSLTGYGQDGPYRDRAGHDLNYQALAGMVGITGTRGGGPVVPGAQVGDLGAGALMAAVAILAAVRHRDRTGVGQHCDVAMLDGLVSLLPLQTARHLADGTVPLPGDDDLTGGHPCYALYRCADGHLSVGALEPRFWQALVERLGLAHLAGEGLAVGDRAAAIHAEVEAVLLQDTRAGWMERFDGADVCCEPVLALDEVFRHPQVRHRGLELPTGVGGPSPVVGSPVRLSATPPRVRLRAPGPGEHTDELLGEAGVGAAQVERLRATGAVG